VSRPSTAWRETPEGDAKYRAARAEAQRAANADGYDRGIEANDLMKEWRVFMLPQKRNRCGHELRCEVVSAMDPTKQKPGHGWAR